MLINYLLIYLFISILTLSKMFNLQHQNESVSVNVSIESVPYMVNLIYDKRHICCGSYITPLWVLTAVHCIRPNWLPHIVVKMGAANATKSYSERRITRAVQHALVTAGDDDSKSWQDNRTMAAINSVGLLMIDKPFLLGPTIQIIDIAQYSHSYEGRAALIAGWGELCFTDRFAYDKLLTAKIVLGRNANGILHRELTKDLCYGDSGSPVVLDSKVIGLVVCGYNCQQLAGLLPNLFIETYPHLKWIVNHTGGTLATCPSIDLMKDAMR